MYKHKFTGEITTSFSAEAYKNVFKDFLEDDEDGSFEITSSEEVPDKDEEEEDKDENEN